MNNWEELAIILEKIDQAEGTNAKTDILTECSDNEDLQLIFKLAFDPYIKFNVTRVDHHFDDLPPRVPIDHDYTMDHFLDDLNKLVQREITGHDALSWVNAINKTLPFRFQPWFEKILKKDLKIGIKGTTLNKVWPDLISEFKIGLCERWKKIKMTDLVFPMLGEPKLDGVRVIAHVKPNESEVIMYSRRGRVYSNFKLIEDELLKIKYPEGVDNWVIDGEIIDKDFQGIMNNARRIHDVDCDNAIFHIWDMLPEETFFSEGDSLDLNQRKTALLVTFLSINKAGIAKPKLPHVNVVPFVEIKSKEEITKWFEHFYGEGYEGLILKNPKSKYIYSAGTKRGKAWIKYKIQDYKRAVGENLNEHSFEIVDLHRGDPGTKYSNTLGRIEFKGTFEDKSITGFVGSGFTDLQRDSYWADRDNLRGHFLDVEFQEVTTDKHGNNSLRFPVFLRMRPDLT